MNPSWTISITRTDNGFLLEHVEQLDDGTETTSQYVIEDNVNDELKSGESLLWQVIEFFNLGGSKYDRERLSVTREGGSKYEKSEEVNEENQENI